ncbi:uncharacterized protein PRCAT00005898001 [Priceomyces carsonii]|uniref:uncharacterized protein n=1 Tax=Priceomyces carsonii TaxID=28549 RepID=UPI002ED87E06|nr:unnamed protein product [Priceomyces carsonii]
MSLSLKDLEGTNPKLQHRLLTPFLSKKVPPLASEEDRKPFPESKANILSKIFFWWLTPILKVGYKRTLTPEDLFYLTDDVKVDTLVEKFYGHYSKRLEKAKQKHLAKKYKERNETPDTSSVEVEDDLQDFVQTKWVTIISVAETFAFRYSLACAFVVLAFSGQTLNPLLSRKLISFVSQRALGLEPHVGKGIGYAIGSTVLVFISGIFFNHFFFQSMMTGVQVKALLTKVILDKSFKLNEESRYKYSVGKITSLMGTDLARIDFALAFQPFLFTAPVPIAIAIIILIVNIGAPALVGVGILFAFLLSMGLIVKKLFAYRSKANSYTDSRVDYIKEVLNNLKVIKFYSWEPPYHKNISDIRNKEMSIIYKMQVWKNFITSMAMSLTFITSMCSFLVLYAINGTRDPADIFASLTLFGLLAQQVNFLPLALASGSDAFIGLSRVGEYLSLDEIDLEQVTIEASPEIKVSMEKDDVAIKVDDATFEWESFDMKEGDDNDNDASHENDDGLADNESKVQKVKESVESTPSEKSYGKIESDESTVDERSFTGLRDVDLTIKKGEFIVVTGLIGSGKTSLLNALSGFMKRSKGSISVNGSHLLCGYPWVQNNTVKNNILFGSDYDEKTYNEVVYACSLESDLDILPAGDNTEIGERGITLSGGQKSRINLARAVYADKDIILMDDVLSAVDARVGKHIMDNCMLGLLKDKTRILATHQLSLIGSADRVIFLNGDGTIEIGTFEELQSKNEGFSKLMNFSNDHESEDEEENDFEDEGDDLELEKEEIKRQVSKKSVQDEEAIHRNFNEGKVGSGKLMEIEGRAVNGIKFEVYRDYVKHGSGIFPRYTVFCFIILCMILSTYCMLFTNTWLSFWTEYKFRNKSNGFYIGFYVMFTFLALIFLTVEFVALAYLANTASVKLNILAIDRVLHAPMAFMDTTPMGRILNRFTKDTEVLDNEIEDELRMLIFTFAQIIGIIILCICYLPWFAIAVPFMIFVVVAIANFYQASAREVKRLEAVQRSFVYDIFNETLGGMPTIKSFQSEGRFLNKLSALIDKMNEAYYVTIANQRWLGVHLDIVTSGFVLLISLLCVNKVFNINASSVGLVLSYSFQITGQVVMLIRTLTQVENQMNSAERLCQYAFNLPQEAPYYIEDTAPKETWPEEGGIVFDQVSLAYRPGLPLVLKSLDFKIRPMEKIGICGRTGAGKSSLMTALYRLTELEAGLIYIDGVDISTIGLYNLRSKLSIIPQDPVLFRGTIRKNLDPFNQSLDDSLWDSLRRSGLIEDQKLEFVKAQKKDNPNMHKFHLDQIVGDEGGNFSLGERQLLAFARAVVRESKILILDEATSSVDYETDAKIQSNIVNEFADCTILCIAHRLKTIINYDKILVLDKGEKREFDTPWNLFNRDGSIFQQMCHRSKIVAEDFERKDV